MCPDQIGDAEPDMDPSAGGGSPAESPYGDPQHNLSRPVSRNPIGDAEKQAQMMKTQEALKLLGAGQGFPQAGQ